jgi:hypothetical protein
MLIEMLPKRWDTFVHAESFQLFSAFYSAALRVGEKKDKDEMYEQKRKKN